MSTRRFSLQRVRLSDASFPNAGLWLDKFIPEQDKSRKEDRSKFVKEVASIEHPASYSEFYKRWKQCLEDLRGTGCMVVLRVAEANGRLILGTGNESVLETAITLHRTYGVPYIPGSALKGLAASFARSYCGSSWTKDSEAYRIVFGRTDESGCVTFFDALPDPETAPRFLHTDVLTVHHRDYYQSGASVKPPADWDDPNPVPFLSATGKYLVALAASSGGKTWLNASFAILGAALAEVGVGAKTSSGYGRLKMA